MFNIHIVASRLLRYQRIRRTLRITPSTPRVVSEPPRTEDKSKKKEKRVLIAVPAKPSKTPKQQEDLKIPTKPSKTPIDPPKKRKCPLCDEKFDTQCKLRRHMYHHTDLRPYECDVCGNAFKRSKELSLHKQIHLGIQYECAECRFTTTNRLSLNLHQRRLHQGAFAYYCDECGKGFMSQYYLRDHIARHQGKKSHVCEVCSKSYFRIASLQAHKFKIHGLSNRPREYKCNICPKSFVTADSLRVHVENHARKFQCEQCGTEFSTKPALALHILKHTGEKPYTCDTCGIAFTTARVLRVHSMIHTGEKPFLCDVCGRSFGQKGTLMAHCRNVHR